MRKMKLPKFLALYSSILLLLNGCSPAFAPAAVGSSPSINTPPSIDDGQYSIAEIEKLTGFDVKEPAYLPSGVSLDHATYESSPSPRITLHYKLVHETYGDMGALFQITQEPQQGSMTDPTVCGASGSDCEILQAGDNIVKYRLSAPTESLIWSMDGFLFHLLRTAGEPNRIYKDELLKVVASMK